MHHSMVTSGCVHQVENFESRRRILSARVGKFLVLGVQPSIDLSGSVHQLEN